MKIIHALSLATALTFAAGAAFAQSSAPGPNQGGASATESQKSGSVKADGVDQAKQGGAMMAPASSTTGAAIQANDAKAGMTKDKGGLATPSAQENKMENTTGPK